MSDVFGDFMIGEAVKRDQEMNKLRDERNALRAANAGMKRQVQTAISAIGIVDRLLIERGYTEDSSCRHNLAIALSNLRDADNQTGRT